MQLGKAVVSARMHFFRFLVIIAVLSKAAAGPVSFHLREADFMSSRKTQTRDMSGRGGDPAAKYFRTYREFIVVILRLC
jgi:hypothetical protein